MRRLVALVILACLASSLLAQRREGAYANTPWSINEHHTLIWGGTPYIPVGIRVDGTPTAVKAAAESKIQDLLIDLPSSGAGWADTIAASEEAKARYLIRINSMAPMAQGFAVEPQGYRIPGISKATKIDIPMPGAVSAFVVLAAKRDGAVSTRDRVPIINGRLVYEAKPGPQFEHVLLIYPEMTSAEQPDYWDGLDQHRDTLLASLKRYKPGAGLRGIVNPLGHAIELPGKDVQFVPTSKYFRLELRNYLEQRYKSMQTLTRSWSIGASDLATFDDVARLVPLWNGERGIPNFLDPKTNKLYPSDRRYSNAWADITQVVQVAGVRRFDRLVSAIRSVVDVPVVQEWAGWASPYETASPAVDGVGMRSLGTSPSAVAEAASRAASSVLRWQTRGWLLATDVDLGPGSEPAQLPLVLDDMSALGARGFFVRTEDAKFLPALVSESQRKAADSSLANVSPRAVFYPENATHPAHPQRLVGGMWWLPTPADGNRIDLGSQFFAYRMPGETVMWAAKPGRYKLRMADPKKAAFRAIDGSDPDPRAGKNYVEVNLTQFPTVISGSSEVPIPELAYTEAFELFEKMRKTAEETRMDIIEERLGFRTAMAGFEQNPGGSFPGMRLMIYRLAYKTGNFIWQEAERTSVTNFSESGSLPGASNSQALMLDTRIEPSADGYYAEYTVPVRHSEEQEVWIAARIPQELRERVTVFVGGQSFRLSAQPEVMYGRGIGWYKLGTTKLAGSTSTVRIVLDAAATGVALDTILISPFPFTPSGATPPVPIAGT